MNDHIVKQLDRIRDLLMTENCRKRRVAEIGIVAIIRALDSPSEAKVVAETVTQLLQDLSTAAGFGSHDPVVVFKTLQCFRGRAIEILDERDSDRFANALKPFDCRLDSPLRSTDVTQLLHECIVWLAR